MTLLVAFIESQAVLVAIGSLGQSSAPPTTKADTSTRILGYRRGRPSVESVHGMPGSCACTSVVPDSGSMRRMKDAAFREQERDRLFDGHVAPVNSLVDELSGGERGWMPHGAPLHGGTGARLLWVFRDPGPMTVDPENPDRGFLCVENDDPTAARLCELIDLAGIDVGETMPWNAYPWYINKAPTLEQLRAGAEVLFQILLLTPRTEVVLLCGNEAHRCWDLLTASHTDVPEHLAVLRTRHTSRQAFVGTSEQRGAWRAEQEEVFRDAGRRLHPALPSSGRLVA